MSTQPTGALAGHLVGRVGYGAMQLAERRGGPVDAATAHAVLRRAVELGVNHIDTALFYGAGRADAFIREALHPYPADLGLVSKVGARRDVAGALVPAQQPHELRTQVEDELQALAAERLDVVNLRRVDGGTGITATGDQLVDLDDQLAELAAMRDEGLIGAIGLSAITVEQLRQAEPVGVACVQNQYNLLERDDEPTLRECAATDVAYVPFFPLGSGFPGRPKVTDQPLVREIATQLGATPAQVGLAWLLARDPHVLLIPGTTSVEHLEQNVAAASLRLDDDQLARLNAIAAG